MRGDWYSNDEAGAAAWEWNHTLPADDRPTFAQQLPDCCPDPTIAAARLCGCW